MYKIAFHGIFWHNEVFFFWNVDLKIKIFSHVCITTQLTIKKAVVMRGNLGQKLQNCLKLPRIHVRLYCNANDKS